MTTTEAEAAIEWIKKELERNLDSTTEFSNIEIQLRLENMRSGILEPVYPEACDGRQVRLLLERAGKR